MYKRRDEHAVTHFSHKPPGKPPQDLEIIELDSPRPAAHAFNDYYSIINQARRMEGDRRKRVRKTFLRRLALQQARLKSDQEYSQDGISDTTYIPDYGYYRHPSHVYGYHYPYGKHSRRTGHGYRPQPKPFRGAYPRFHPGYGNRTSRPPAVLNLGR